MDRQVARQGPFTFVAPAQFNPSVEATEAFLADNFVRINQGRLRWDVTAGAWYIFNGNTWDKDERNLVLHEISEHCRQHDNPLKPKFTNAKTVRAVEYLATINIAITATSADWDCHPYILATPSGHIDLKTGLAIPPRADLMLTQRTDVAPQEGEPEHWLRFLQEATSGDHEFVDYLKRVLGYCLTGDTKEHALFFIYGPGGSGKSTFVNTAQDIIGGYAWAAPMEMFVKKKGDAGIPNDVARLHRRRFITASETERGRTWGEARVKQMTGGDALTARHLYGEFFTFNPTHKIMIMGNHAPHLDSTGPDMRRRFHVIPFNLIPAQNDPDLMEKLKAEAPKILRWMIDGARKWHQQGLRPPAVIVEKTDTYFETQDFFAEWLRQCTLRAPSASDMRETLYTSYKSFMERNGEPALTGREFTARLDSEFNRKRVSKGWSYLGVRVGI